MRPHSGLLGSIGEENTKIKWMMTSPGAEPHAVVRQVRGEASSLCRYATAA
jgi:hypothetical protein